MRLWFAVYVAAMLVGGALFGNVFYERADPFEVYSTLVGQALGLGACATAGCWCAARWPTSPRSRPLPGLLGVVGVLFGSTGFDSFGESPPWVKFLQGTDISGYLLNNLTLRRLLPRRDGRLRARLRAHRRRARASAAASCPTPFAHSIVPIVVGYVVAHYLSYLLEVGSRTLMLASDPFSNGSDYLGTGDLDDVTWLAYHPTLLANLKVGAVVVGHVLAAVVAHDRALGCCRRATSSPVSCRCCWRWSASPAAGCTCCSSCLSRAPAPARPARARAPPATRPATARSGRSRRASSRVRPATSARSTAARSSGRKCSPASRAKPATMPATSFSDQPRVGRIRLTTTCTGVGPSALAQVDQPAGQPGQPDRVGGARPRPPRRRPRARRGSAGCGPGRPPRSAAGSSSRLNPVSTTTSPCGAAELEEVLDGAGADLGPPVGPRQAR